MATYFLFLDELKASKEYSHFCLGGCIIEETVYKKDVIPFINNLKQTVFGNTTSILHETKIRYAKEDPYKIFKKKSSDSNQQFWGGMKAFFSKDWTQTMCVGIHYEDYKSIYKCKTNNDEYFIALQIILENFAHFLDSKNSMGSVYIESRGLVDDQLLDNHYNTIKDNGTLFIDCKVFQERLKTISFPMKADNNIGIQVADFIPNPIARHLAGLTQRDNSLFSEIHDRLYDGDVNLVDRFGLKKVL